jgi:hypothetical protein
MREYGAVGMTGGVHTSTIDRRARFEIEEQRLDESDVIHCVVERVTTAAVAGVPG